jgi:mannose-6-phosphate isomerase-like protein (cupin superfamily)
MVQCTLPPGAVALAVTHKTVAEVWYFLEGEGQVWRKQGDREEITEVEPGLSLSIPFGTHFQFRNTGQSPLRFVIVTLPPWPGQDEAQRVADYWPTG